REDGGASVARATAGHHHRSHPPDRFDRGGPPERGLRVDGAAGLRKPRLRNRPGSPIGRSIVMPRGSKRKYSDKQKRKAEHIAEGYVQRGISKKTAKARAW